MKNNLKLYFVISICFLFTNKCLCQIDSLNKSIKKEFVNSKIIKKNISFFKSKLDICFKNQISNYTAVTYYIFKKIRRQNVVSVLTFDNDSIANLQFNILEKEANFVRQTRRELFQEICYLPFGGNQFYFVTVKSNKVYLFGDNGGYNYSFDFENYNFQKAIERQNPELFLLVKCLN